MASPSFALPSWEEMNFMSCDSAFWHMRIQQKGLQLQPSTLILNLSSKTNKQTNTQKTEVRFLFFRNYPISGIVSWQLKWISMFYSYKIQEQSTRKKQEHRM